MAGIVHIVENWRYWSGEIGDGTVRRVHPNMRKDASVLMMRTRSLLCCMRQIMTEDDISVDDRRAQALGSGMHRVPGNHLRGDQFAYVLLNNFKSDYLRFLLEYNERTTNRVSEEYSW